MNPLTAFVNLNFILATSIYKNVSQLLSLNFSDKHKCLLGTNYSNKVITKCFNTIGSIRCQCIEGFVRDGITCTS